ncbi:MAG: exodeoxyribonuclease VII small subunit [Planctomycetes bacterium]|nr:exodeoxyribonuclease VII small subunit [Planctomycetota bacterium]
MAKEKVKFEAAFSRLEELVGELESGELSLDDSLEKYGEAVKALKLCRKMLGDAEKKIEVLTKDEKGNLQTQAASLDVSEGDRS